MDDIVAVRVSLIEAQVQIAMEALGLEGRLIFTEAVGFMVNGEYGKAYSEWQKWQAAEPGENTSAAHSIDVAPTPPVAGPVPTVAAVAARPGTEGAEQLLPHEQ